MNRNPAKGKNIEESIMDVFQEKYHMKTIVIHNRN